MDHPLGRHRWQLASKLTRVLPAIVTPVEVAFLPPPETGVEPLFLINRLVLPRSTIRV